MSISLSTIGKNGKVNVFNFLENYIKSLNFLFIDSELESFVYARENQRSVISLAVENEGKVFGPAKEVLFQNLKIANRNIAVLKVEHENSKESRLEVLKKLAFLKGVTSRFVVLEQTAMFDNIENRPPRLTNKGSLYFPVGKITNYFDAQVGNEDYEKDSRGIEYAKASGEKNLVSITDRYYSSFIDNDLEGLIDINQTGLKHFSTVIHDLDGKLSISFLQNSNINIARYFFDPEIFFCSNEAVLKYIRGLRFGDNNIKIKRNLKLFSTLIN